jgi:LPXTG-motif cell wall-anchored protein
MLSLVYAGCALIVPGAILAQDESPTTAPTQTTPTETTPTETTPTETTPADAPPAPPPEPQVLADETKEAPASPPKAIAAASGGVTIADFSFSPGSITINQGDTVTWVNNGPTPHSATANNGSFNTGILKAGQSASHTFAQAGTYSYFCQPHPFMKGTVVVQAAQTGSSGSGGSGSSGTTGSAGGSGSTGTPGAGAAQADGGPTLPNTGGDAAPLLVLGALMLLLGFAAHRRTA